MLFFIILNSVFLCSQLKNSALLFSFDTTHSRVKTDSIEPSTIWVEGGTMKLGCINEQSPYYCMDHEKPVHFVTISGFHIGKYEVTNSEFCRFLNANKDSLTYKYAEDEYYASFPIRAYWHKYYNGYNFIIEDIDRGIMMPKKGQSAHFTPYPGFENHPVRMVSFLAALKYTEWLSKVSGKTYRLPTEAEWEYAARGGKLSNCHKDSCFIFAGSSTAHEVVNMTGYTNTVGKEKPNELGIYDMSGNVYEWVLDVYDANYYQSIFQYQEDPVRTYEGTPFVNYDIRFKEKNSPFEEKSNDQTINSDDSPSVSQPYYQYDTRKKELERVIKGGGFINDPTSWRVSYRDYSIKADHTIGFRVVMEE